DRLDRAHRPRVDRGGEPDHGDELRSQDRRRRPTRRDGEGGSARGLSGSDGVSVALAVESVDAGYGDFQALFGVSLEVDEGQTVAIIGANGAGKSTLLRAVMGQVRLGRGVIRYRGEDLGPLATHSRVARGLALVP